MSDSLPISWPINTLPNNGVKVLLMRRTTNDTVKTAVGHKGPTGQIWGWAGSRPPTHWIELPPGAMGEKR